MKFREWVVFTEMFSTSVPIRWTKKSPDLWTGTFTIQGASPNPANPAIPIKNKAVLPKGLKYLIRMVKMDMDDMWEVSFDLMDGGIGRQDITGTGNAALVFSTVLVGIRQWAEAVKPASFALSAREPNRQSLYRRMLEKMLDPRVWEVEDMGTTFFVQNKTMQPARAFGNSFDDYFDDDDDY